MIITKFIGNLPKLSETTRSHTKWTNGCYELSNDHSTHIQNDRKSSEVIRNNTKYTKLTSSCKWHLGRVMWWWSTHKKNYPKFSEVTRSRTKWTNTTQDWSDDRFSLIRNDLRFSQASRSHPKYTNAEISDGF